MSNKENKITNTNREEFNSDWLMGGNPGAIEAQESRGQKQLVESSQLPSKRNTYSYDNGTASDIYKKMGINVVGETSGDDLFLDVQLPEGWKLEITDHSMWNRLVDDKGRERASIFYKAAFYDRDAFINFKCRYICTTEYVEKEDGDEFHPKCYLVKDTATGEILFKTEITNKYYDEVLENEANEWLKKNYPKHDNIYEYWDE